MFKYEDMDFQSLTTSLDIENPDGPEELYAMAQFCRMGKGTQASEENYRLYLQRAADAGSEQARQELNAQSSADTAAAAETPADATAVADMSLPELMQAADNGNPYALLPLAKKAMSRERSRMFTIHIQIMKLTFPINMQRWNRENRDTNAFRLRMQKLFW